MRVAPVAVRVIPGLAVVGLLAIALMSPFRLPSSVLALSACVSGAGGAPTITSVSPTSGTAAGGTVVTITGCAFTGTTGVKFGTTTAAFTFNSDTSVSATSPAGTLGATVDIRVTSASGTSATSSADSFTFTQPPCATVALSADKASPQPAGSVITFTASSTGCAFPEYQFWLQLPNGVWMLQKSYDGATWAWNTVGLANGNYVVNVWAREIGSGRTLDVNLLMPYTIGPGAACTAAGLTSDKASPQQIDFTITFTGSATTCTAPEFLFYLQSPNGAWTLERGYGGPTWAWDTTQLASIGNYVVNVWVREIGSGVAVQANHLMPFTITDRVCSSAGLTANKASPQVHGAVITFTATSAGCARPSYLFYLKGPGVNGTWSVVQGYDGTTWTWSTANVASVGTYEVNVWVTAVGSPSAVQTNAVMFYLLT